MFDPGSSDGARQELAFAMRNVAFLALAVAVCSVLAAGIYACSCTTSSTGSPTALTPGDAGRCSTAETSKLPDGGYSTVFVPCAF